MSCLTTPSGGGDSIDVGDDDLLAALDQGLEDMLSPVSRAPTLTLSLTLTLSPIKII